MEEIERMSKLGKNTEKHTVTSPLNLPNFFLMDRTNVTHFHW